MSKNNVESLQKDNNIFEQALNLYMRLNYGEDLLDEEIMN